jgi:hypothetical protein
VAALTAVCVSRLANAIVREAQYPSRPELHERIGRFEAAGKLLQDELTDPVFRALLSSGSEPIENENEGHAWLRHIVALATQVRVGAPRKQGKGKLYPLDAAGPSAMALCALTACIVLELVTGEWPPTSNTTAHQFCEGLWIAAGGPRRAGWGNPGSVVVWRDHARSARKYRPPHAAGTLIQRDITANTWGPEWRNMLNGPAFDLDRARRRRQHATRWRVKTP